MPSYKERERVWRSSTGGQGGLVITPYDWMLFNKFVVIFKGLRWQQRGVSIVCVKDDEAFTAPHRSHNLFSLLDQNVAKVTLKTWTVKVLKNLLNRSAPPAGSWTCFPAKLGQVRKTQKNARQAGEFWWMQMLFWRLESWFEETKTD